MFTADLRSAFVSPLMVNITVWSPYHSKDGSLRQIFTETLDTEVYFTSLCTLLCQECSK